MATTHGCKDIHRKPLHIISKQTVGFTVVGMDIHGSTVVVDRRFTLSFANILELGAWDAC